MTDYKGKVAFITGGASGAGYRVHVARDRHGRLAGSAVVTERAGRALAGLDVGIGKGGAAGGGDAESREKEGPSGVEHRER